MKTAITARALSAAANTFNRNVVQVMSDIDERIEDSIQDGRLSCYIQLEDKMLIRKVVSEVESFGYGVDLVDMDSLTKVVIRW